MFLQKSTILHLRIPFSLYLMPVFCFAVSAGFFENVANLLLVFLSIHLFLYPASNGYNSYYDKDEGSIGGLEKPPAVSSNLLYTSLGFDIIAILLGLVISWEFAIMLFVYGMVSKAYSHPSVRLKKYPVSSLVTAAFFQGTFTYLMVYAGLHHLSFYELLQSDILFPATIAGVMILGFYPLTQVYQHEEDSRRGDHTFSLMAGIKGTFHFSILVFAVSDILFYFYFRQQGSIEFFWIFQAFMLPLFSYLVIWYRQVRKDELAANFRATMRMNQIASVCLVTFFSMKALVNFL